MLKKITEDRNRIGIIIIASITPVVGMILAMFVQGLNIGDISIKSSYWNDELFYYKQIESMIKYGSPQGYFGFNETTSILGHFGAWPFTCFLHYVLIGKLFGWNDYVPVVVNLISWIIAFTVFAKVLKPSLVQQISASLIWIAFGLNVRYILSVTPESLIAVLLLMFAVFAYKIISSDTIERAWLIPMDVCFVWLTLMRGYYGVLGLLLIGILWQRKEKKNIIIHCAIVVVSLVTYMLLMKFFTAEYFTSTISGESLANPKAIIKALLIGTMEAAKYIWLAITRADTMDSIRGTWYVTFLIVGIWLLFRLKQNKYIYSIIMVCFCILLSAMFILYNAKEGSRHLMAVGVVGIMMASYISSNTLLNIFLIAACIWTTWLSQDRFYTTLPKANEDKLQACEVARQDMEHLMILDEAPWNNTVIWTLSMDYNSLYALPVGFGINCCDDSWVIENLDTINSKYVAVDRNEDIYKVMSVMSESNYKEVVSYQNTIIYAIR